MELSQAQMSLLSNIQSTNDSNINTEDPTEEDEPMAKRLRLVERRLNELEASMDQVKLSKNNFERAMPALQNLTSMFNLQTNHNVEMRTPHIMEPRFMNGKVLSDEEYCNFYKQQYLESHSNDGTETIKWRVFCILKPDRNGNTLQKPGNIETPTILFSFNCFLQANHFHPSEIIGRQDYRFSKVLVWFCEYHLPYLQSEYGVQSELEARRNAVVWAFIETLSKKCSSNYEKKMNQKFRKYNIQLKQWLGPLANDLDSNFHKV